MEFALALRLLLPFPPTAIGGLATAAGARDRRGDLNNLLPISNHPADLFQAMAPRFRPGVAELFASPSAP